MSKIILIISIMVCSAFSVQSAKKSEPNRVCVKELVYIKVDINNQIVKNIIDELNIDQMVDGQYFMQGVKAQNFIDKAKIEKPKCEFAVWVEFSSKIKENDLIVVRTTDYKSTFEAKKK